MQTLEEKIQIIKDNIKTIEKSLEESNKEVLHLRGYLGGLKVALEILTK